MIQPVPDYLVTVDGRDITRIIRGTVTRSGGRTRPRLISMGISEKRGEEADTFDLVLDDSDDALDLPPTGAKIRVSLGWRQGTGVEIGLVDKGEFHVESVAHGGSPPALTIRAKAADFTAGLKQRRERGHNATTLGAIVANIAQAHGLQSRCAAALASIAVEAKAQSRESDLAFLRRLGREYDAVATVKAGALIFKPVGDGKSPSGADLPSISIVRASGDAHQFDRQKRDDAEGVQATWHNRATGRRETFVSGKKDGARRLSRVYATEEAAQQAAKAAHGRAAREPVSFSINLALGRADLGPEQKARVSGFKRQIDAIEWLVTEVSHSLGDGGFRSQIKLELA
ncbi:contractile injection system protein, VgrG/Pvc8 family [Sphingomonas zeae]